MLETDANKSIDKEQIMKMTLTDTQQNELKRMLKCGIYKELYKRDMLSDVQLNSLLEHNS